MFTTLVVATVLSRSSNVHHALRSGSIARANRFTGVAESGMEFGSSKLPGLPFKDYAQPSNDSVAYFAAANFNLIRLPFLWERLQPTLRSPLDPAYSKLIAQTVESALSHDGMSVLLDVHNYARYRGSVIGESGGNVTAADFADLWSRLAQVYGSPDPNDRVLFGLMNEPHGMQTTTVLNNANAAIAAIRQTGAKNIITICGNGYSGVHSWFDGGNESNATIMGGVVDPDDNYMYEMHQYLDKDSSGSHPNCTLTNASTVMSPVTAWLRAQGKAGVGKQAILGEWAGANNTDCHTGVLSMLNFMANNSDAWAGWSWWAAGPWWGPYMYSLEPNKPCPPRDQPQEHWLEPYVELPTRVDHSNNVDVINRTAAFQQLVKGASAQELTEFQHHLEQALRVV
eukprot:m.136732 g.136732  ORF g.136732 m.136732 type:complete len:398 (+) comp11443_c0_seq4:209-1402(+)